MHAGLSDEFVNEGKYSLKFAYKETRNGWAGCEIRKEADWSKCDALSFWVLPDGRNQKTVIQINTRDGGSYEAYLQEYPEYASAEGPIMVTLPFSEFVDKGGNGSLSPQAAEGVSAVGLWVNAVPDSEAMGADGFVSGVIYYDDIRAVESGASAPVFEGTGLSAGLSETSGTEAEDQEIFGRGGSQVPPGRYVVPVISGGVALLAAACLAWLIWNQRRRGR